MTTQEIINHFEDIRKNNPQLYYGGLGAGADSIVMNPFVSGSYELGLVIGAKYALEYFAKATLRQEQPEVAIGKVVMIDNVIMNMTAEGYNNGYKTRPFYEEVLRRLNARKDE